MSGESIDLVIELLEENPDVVMSTLATPIRSREQLRRPGLRQSGLRRARPGAVFQPQPDSVRRASGTTSLLAAEPAALSISTSACTPTAAISCCSWPQLPPAPLEKLEKLEQLRVLEDGHAIAVGVVDEPTVGIDTPEDYRAFVSRMLVA